MAEDAARKYERLEAQYRKLFRAVECSPASVIITDRSGNIEYVNPKFTEITGYSLAEVEGKSPRILKSGQTPKAVYEKLWKTITAGKEWRGEFVNRKKSGELYSEYAAISPVTDDAGRITHFVAVKENITYSKNAERAREKAHGFLHSVLETVPDPIMVIGIDHRVKFVNRVFEENNPRLAEMGTNPFCYQISHQRQTPCDGDDHPCPLLKVRELGKTVKVEHLHPAADGEPRHIEIIAAPLWGDDGSLEGIIESSRDITDRKRVEEKLRYLAHFDTLTGIPNRQLFYDRMRQAIAWSKRQRKCFALFFIDLDGFKSINDTLGHEAGDLLLKEVAGRLSGLLRQADTVARMGGDEFTVILMEMGAEGDAQVVLRKIVERLVEPYLLKGKQCTVGASVGVALFPRDGDSSEALIAKADAEMYAVKQRR